MGSWGMYGLPGSSRRGRGRGMPPGHDQLGAPYHLSDLVLGLASPGAFPCPENSPSYSLQFSKKAGDGHLVAFGTEYGQLLVLDTRVEARVQRDHNGPVGWGQTDRNTGINSRVVGARAKSRLEWAGGEGKVGLCRSWGVRQPEVVVQYRALINCIFDLEWMLDDTRIVMGCGDAKIRVHDTETNTEVMVLCGHEGSVKTISSNPCDNGVLLSGARDGSFALWDTRLEQDMPLHRMTATEYLGMATAPANRMPTRYLSPVEQVYRANDSASNGRKRPRSFLRRDEIEAKASEGHDVANVPVFTGLPCRSSVTAVQWMPGGQKFLTAGQDGLVKLWDTRYVLRPLQVAGSPANTAPAQSRRRSSRTSTTPRPNACTSPPSPASSATMHPTPTGKAVPRSAAGSRNGGRNWNGAVGLDSRVTGGETVAEEISDRGGRSCGVSSLDVCDDGSRIAVCTVKNHISVYSYAAGSLQSLGSYTGNSNASSYYIKAKLSPDGSLLASGATNDAVCLWQVERPGPPIARLMGHLNEVTGVDWCRAEPLKLASCSDDETVRIWTIDPRRVSNQSASRQPLYSSSSSSSSSAVAPIAGVHRSAGNHDRDVIGRGERLSPATDGRVRSGWPYVVRELGAAGGEGPSGAGHPSGGGGADYVHPGKFGFGTARPGESFRGRRGGTAKALFGCSSRGGSSDWAGRRRNMAGGGGGGGVQGQRQAVWSRSQSVAENTMGVCPQQTSTAGASALSPARTDGARADGGGQVVLSPRSRNQRAADAARTPIQYSRAEAAAADVGAGGTGGTPGSARGFHIGRHISVSSTSSSHSGSAPAQGATTRTRADENTTPGERAGVAATGILVPPKRAALDSETGAAGSFDSGIEMAEDAVLVDDGSAAAGDSKKRSRGPLDGLPRGWSSATRAGKGLQGAEGRRQGQQQQQQEARQKRQKNQKQQKNQEDLLQKGARGASSGRSRPMSVEKRTLMSFWKRSQAGSSRGVHGKAVAEQGGTADMQVATSS